MCYIVLLVADTIVIIVDAIANYKLMKVDELYTALQECIDLDYFQEFATSYQ